MIFDMFGILLHNLKLYSIILHLVAITFAISIIQFYKEARLSHILNGPSMIPDEDIGNKSDITGNQGRFNIQKTVRSQRGITIAGVGSKYSRNTVVARIRDRTMGV